MLLYGTYALRCYVGEFKDKLSKIGDTGESVQPKLDRFLLTYRATPTSLGKSPSELLMNGQPRIRLGALRAKNTKQEVKVFQDNRGNKPKFTLDQAVFVRNLGRGAKWVSGRIMSPRNCDVQIGDTLWKRHAEQMRPRLIPTEQCFELMRELQVSEPRDILTSVRDDMPITTSSPASTKEAEASKPIPVVDTPTIDPEPNVTPTPERPFMQDSNPPTLLPEKPERIYPLKDCRPLQRFY